MKTEMILETETFEIENQEAQEAEAAVLSLAARPMTDLSLESSQGFHEGLECLGRGEAIEAQACFEAVVLANPDFADGHIGLGVAYAVDHKIYQALGHLERATELDPESFHAHFKLGQLYFLLRVPRKGYERMALALGRASSLAERRLVAQLLREERQREKNGVARPTWSKPFSFRSVVSGLGLATVLRKCQSWSSRP